ncbi:MAG: hypothetical protein B0D92_05460 [Spirochaeta sp. LUC14_002_19_P3]|nr:MAG: hypothetical protein B0D92_05460 [Spirochaeta sp. LUC14_002_19_P3]
MVLVDFSSFLDLPRYGITIPSHDSRKTKTLEALKSHPDLSRRIPEWCIEGFGDLLSLEDLLLVHGKSYAGGFFNENARQRIISAFELVNEDGSFNRWVPDNATEPLPAMLPQLIKMVTGPYSAGKIALESGYCHYLGGGTHHGHRDFGHGFCPFNDSALAMRKLMKEKRIKRGWIIDTDAHKGDGTAAIFANDSSVATLSIHMASGWPLDGSLPPGHPSYTPSTYDIPIESGEEHTYLERLEASLKKLKASHSADFAVVLAGADPWEEDELESTSLLNLTQQQLLERDQLVYNFLQAAGLPSVWLTAGGYGQGAWKIYASFLNWVLVKRLGGAGVTGRR